MSNIYKQLVAHYAPETVKNQLAKIEAANDQARFARQEARQMTAALQREIMGGHGPQSGGGGFHPETVLVATP